MENDDETQDSTKGWGEVSYIYSKSAVTVDHSKEDTGICNG